MAFGWHDNCNVLVHFTPVKHIYHYAHQEEKSICIS